MKHTSKGTVHLVTGRQGAGKTTYSIQLAANSKAVHFSIDDWMWRLYGEDLPSPMNYKWIMDRVKRCEDQIWDVTKKMASVGGIVVLDLAFTKFSKRQLYIERLEEENIPYLVHFLDASHAVRRARVLNRNVEKGDTYAFEVTPGMFDFMEGEFDSLTDKELEKAVLHDTTPK